VAPHDSIKVVFNVYALGTWDLTDRLIVIMDDGIVVLN